MALGEMERRVMDCAERGMTVKETAHAVGRSVQMVKVYRRRAYAELGASSDTEAVALYVKSRLARASKRRGEAESEPLGLT